MKVKKLVRGTELRYLLTLYLHRFSATTVSDLVRMLDRRGFCTAGRTSKAVSDALRWEVRRGRVIQYDWGLGGIPRGTEHRMRLREKELLSLVVGHDESDF